MAEEVKTPTVKLKCIRGHPYDATPDMVGLNKTATAFKSACPVCGSPAAVSARDVIKLYRLTDKDASAVLKKFRDGKLKFVTSPDQSEVHIVPSDVDESETDGEDKSGDGEEDGTSAEDVSADETDANPPREEEEQPVENPGDEMGNENDQDESGTGQPDPQPPRITRRAPLPGQPRAPAPASPVDDDEGPIITEDDVELSPKDVLISVVRASGIAKDDIEQLVGLIKYRSDWDPWTAKTLFDTFGFSEGVARKLSQKFQTRLESHRLAREHNKRLTNLVTSGIPQGRMGQQFGPMPSAGGYGDQMGMPTTEQRFGPAPVDTTDPTNAAVQAIINAAGGRITPQVMAAIDAVRSAMGTGLRPQGAAAPSSGNSELIAIMQTQNMQTMKLFETMMIGNQRQKDEEAERKKEEAMAQKFEQMQNMILQLGARMQAPPAAPQQPQIADVLLTLLKDKMANDGKKDGGIQDTMFLKMFDNVMESGKGANESVAQAISELRNEMAQRLGGGIGGIPSNPEQLKGIIDLQRLSAEVEKTRNEFASSAANREMISGIAETAFQTIGQALTAKFTTDTGTPQEKSVTVKEQPIDDGSVVQIDCPKCGVTMTAPADALAIKCPKCGSVLDRVKATKEEVRIREEPQSQPQPTSQDRRQPAPEPEPQQEVPQHISGKSSVVNEKNWVPVSPQIPAEEDEETDVFPDDQAPEQIAPVSPGGVERVQRILGLGNTPESDLSQNNNTTQDETAMTHNSRP